MKKLTLSLPKPRNPLVAAARFRQAGRHRPEAHGVRQQAKRDLRREENVAKGEAPPGSTQCP